MPWITDQNGFTYWVDDQTGQIITPVSSPEPVPEPPPAEPPSTPAQTAPTPADTWKPDFTQPDPWEGMPPDYGGTATFTPTPENPTPPWEGSPGATSAGIPTYGTPEYEQKAAEVAQKVVAPYVGPDGQIDLEAVAVAGKVEYLRPLGVSESVIRQAQQYTQERGAISRAEAALEPYRTGAGYNVSEAVKGGKETALKAVGFTEADIAAAREYTRYKEEYDASRGEFERTHVFIPHDPEIANSRGVWITQESFEALPRDARELVLEKGINALNTYYGKTAKDAATMLPADAAELYKDQSPQDKFAILKAYGVVPWNAEYVKPDIQGNPMYKIGTGQSEAIISTSNMPLLIGDVFIPGFATVRHWNQMGTGEKALSLALDALILIPVAGAAGKGARAATTVTRTGRLAGAAKGIGREALLQLKAPVDVVLHPVQTVKGTVATGRDLIENIAHWRKLPEAVITTTNGTVRIPVSRLKTEADALKARDALIDAASRGAGDIIVEMNGQRFQLSRSALMNELGGGLAHTTPMGEAFEQGLKVTAKPGMPLSEQGLFVANEPLPRFAPQAAFGGTGTKPAFVIVAPDIARDAMSTQKAYGSAAGRVAELEKKFPVDYQLPAPTQRLFTRVGPQRTRVEILLVGFDKQLSAAQITKLKALAVVEDLKATIKPALRISGASPKASRAIREGLTADDVARLAGELRAAGNHEIAENLMRIYRTSVAVAARPRGDLVASGSIRQRSPSGMRRDNIVMTVEGTPRTRIQPTDRLIQPVAYRHSPTTVVMSGRVEIPRTNEPLPGTRNLRVSDDVPRPRAPDIDAPTRPPVLAEDRPPAPPEVRRTPPPIVDTGRTPPSVPDMGRVPPRIPDRVEPPRQPTPNIPRIPSVDTPGRPTRYPPLPPGKPPEPFRKRGKSNLTDSEKRRRIAAADTKVTYQQGKLKVKGKLERVHHVVYGKDGQFEKTTVLGAAPEGARVAEGKGQSYATVTVAKGVPPPNPIKLEGGAVDPVVSPTADRRGVSIRFVHDEEASRRKEKPMFRINRKGRGGSRSMDLGADIVRDRRGRHLRL